MFYIVGLGNPGEQYTNTRHNVGWMVLMYVIEKHELPMPVDSAQYSGRVCEGVLHGEEIRVLFPSTFMNKSGSAVRKLVPEKEEAKKLIVMYDDVDLVVGDIRLSFGRSSGGHKGVQSIIKALGTRDFMRIRIGVASRGFFGNVRRPKGERLSKHVLGAFKKNEIELLEEVKLEADAALGVILQEGIEIAMNRFN